MSKKSTPLILVTLLVACTPKVENTLAQPKPKSLWNLVTDQSTLSFVSTKNKTHTEEHSLQFLQGNIQSNHQLILEIDLNTVDTLIPVRDQRLKDILFETDQFPIARITADLPSELVMDNPTQMAFNLDLHGVKKNLNSTVIIQEVDNQLVVVNFEPNLINGKDFLLDDAINQLTKIAGLQSINYEVLVDFKLTFEK